MNREAEGRVRCRGDRPAGLSVPFVRRGGTPPAARFGIQWGVPLLQATLTNRLTSLFHDRLAGARTSVSAHSAFIRSHPHRWAGNPRGPEIPIRSLTFITRKGTRTSVAGGRTSVSAPLSVHPRILAPMGSQSAWAVRAAGRSSEDRRTSGQRTRVEWKRRS